MFMFLAHFMNNYGFLEEQNFIQLVNDYLMQLSFKQ